VIIFKSFKSLVDFKVNTKNGNRINENFKKSLKCEDNSVFLIKKLTYLSFKFSIYHVKTSNLMHNRKMSLA